MRTIHISTPRKIFRGCLLIVAFLSFLFFTAIVAFRVNPDARHFLMDNTEYVFTVDILQHKALSLTKDIDGKFDIAVSLIRKGFFSPQYTQAGAHMLKKLADQGHAPSQTVHANLLLLNNYAEHKNVAEHYYTLAAGKGYKPAQEKLAEIYYEPF